MKKMIMMLTCVSAIIITSADADIPLKLDTNQIETLTGAKGELDKESGVFKVSVPRKDLKVNAAGVHLTPGLGLTLSQLAPGPLAAQLAIYLGWIQRGILGATFVSFAFIS